jgi:alkanesulfonate monooxygenase SsuD/methylene tetrahydromethanopterin reductase-like flavin-dependent oxidoreductase (luciferase family)
MHGRSNTRQRRLNECATIVRGLWAGDTVTTRGSVVTEAARLYARPQDPPLLLAQHSLLKPRGGSGRGPMA